MAMLEENGEVYVGCLLEKLCWPKGVCIASQRPLPFNQPLRAACIDLSQSAMAVDTHTCGLPEPRPASNNVTLRACRSVAWRSAQDVASPTDGKSGQRWHDAYWLDARRPDPDVGSGGLQPGTRATPGAVVKRWDEAIAKAQVFVRRFALSFWGVLWFGVFFCGFVVWGRVCVCVRACVEFFRGLVPGAFLGSGSFSVVLSLGLCVCVFMYV